MNPFEDAHANKSLPKSISSLLQTDFKLDLHKCYKLVKWKYKFLESIKNKNIYLNSCKEYCFILLLNKTISEVLQCLSLEFRMPWNNLKFKKVINITVSEVIIRLKAFGRLGRSHPYKLSSVSQNQKNLQSSI